MPSTTGAALTSFAMALPTNISVSKPVKIQAAIRRPCSVHTSQVPPSSVENCNAARSIRFGWRTREDIIHRYSIAFNTPATTLIESAPAGG